MGRFRDYVLGGATSPMAGDGYGYNPALRKSSKQSRPVGLGDHSSTDEDLEALSIRSLEPPPITLMSPENNIDHGNEENLNAANPWVEAAGLRDATRLTARSPACKARGTTSVQSPRTSGETFRTCSEDSAVEAPQESMQNVFWQEHEIPEELAIVEDGTPEEVRIIVQESLDEQQAIKASLLQCYATRSDADQGQSSEGGLAIGERSSMPSSLSSPSSEGSRSSFYVPASSSTSLETKAEDSIHPRPSPTASQPSSLTASREILHSEIVQDPEITEMEKRFLDSKARLKKGQRLIKLLRHERVKRKTTQGRSKVETTMVECTSCFDDLPDSTAVALSCRHYYCKLCFVQLVSTAIEHEINFPPKCCLTEISKKTIRDNLPAEICAKFELKALEYAVPAGNRYYCVSSTCGKWIDTRHARHHAGAVECHHCGTKLCSVCRGPQHPANEDCPQDFGLDRTLEQAERAGWRRCYNCRAMVELNHGCRHITCKCRAEFCYTCGAKWRTCACTESDQARRNEEVRIRIEQYEADQRAQEEEVRAATVAVEEAERQLREEREAEEARLAEEARELERMENERVQSIAMYFQYLRGVLDRVRSQQTMAITRRHNVEWANIDGMKNDLDSAENITKREADVQAERDKIMTGTGNTIKALQRQHATTMMELVTRHRKDQDALLAPSIDTDDPDAAILRSETLQDLMPIQHFELTELRSQQARDIQKWRDRCGTSLQAFDARDLLTTLRLEDENAIKLREQQMRSIAFADNKWTDVLFEERVNMLADDERRFIRNGGEAPAMPQETEVSWQPQPERMTPEVPRAADQSGPCHAM